MNDLNKANEILHSITSSTTNEEIIKIAIEAFEESKLCIDAAIILSRNLPNFFDKETILLESINALVNEFNIKNTPELYTSIIRSHYELGSLYYEAGKLKEALKVLKLFDKEDSKLPFKYKIIAILASLEDESINDYYNNHIKDINDIEFVRLSFPYMIYLYKLNKSEYKDIFSKIKEINPDFIKVLKDEIKEGEENENALEALKVLKNNSQLINSCPYIIKDLISL